MSTPYPPYKSTGNFNTINRSPKFNIATEPHYKITQYLEEDSINIPNKKVLNKIILNALNKKKYQGRIDLNVPGNKDVITDSDSEQHFKEDKMKRINKNMLQQNGCADLIIKKIESQAPQKNEEYYKFTNQKNYLRNNDPYYGTRTLTNWNHEVIDDQNLIRKEKEKEEPLYIQTEQNNYHNRVLTTTDIEGKNRPQGDYNYHFNSTIDLRQIIKNNRKKPNQVKEITQSPNQQIDYESSADAEQGSSSYVYMPAKNTNVKNKKNYKENELSSQSISNNEEPYVKKNFEIKTKKFTGKNNYKVPSNRPTINELINLNSNKKGFSVLQNRFNQKLIKNVVKIQSAWRGYFTRDTINKNLNLIRFLIVLMETIKNKYMDYIAKIFNNMRYLKIKNEKKENYDGLLKDYNLLLNEYNKLEKELNDIKKIQKVNRFDNLNIDTPEENNFEILDINIDSPKENMIKEENIKEESIKKEILFEPEQKEQFSILKVTEKRTRLRGRNKKQDSKNKNEEYINHFISNINISNTEQFMIEEKKPLISEEPENKIEKKEIILVEETQKEMNIELKLQRKFADNMISERKNEINITPIIEKIQLDENKLNQEFKNDDLMIERKSDFNIEERNKLNQEFKNDDLVIVKKSNFNLQEKNKLNQEFKNDDLIIVKKNNFNIEERNKLNQDFKNEDLMIEKKSNFNIQERNKLNQQFKNDDLIIVKKSNFNIQERNKLNQHFKNDDLMIVKKININIKEKEAVKEEEKEVKKEEEKGVEMEKKKKKKFEKEEGKELEKEKEEEKELEKVKEKEVEKEKKEEEEKEEREEEIEKEKEVEKEVEAEEVKEEEVKKEEEKEAEKKEEKEEGEEKEKEKEEVEVEEVKEEEVKKEEETEKKEEKEKEKEEEVEKEEEKEEKDEKKEEKEKEKEVEELKEEEKEKEVEIDNVKEEVKEVENVKEEEVKKEKEEEEKEEKEEEKKEEKEEKEEKEVKEEKEKEKEKKEEKEEEEEKGKKEEKEHLSTNYLIEKNMMFIKKSKIKKKDKKMEISEELINKNDFNKKNEIDKKESLEINPKEKEKDIEKVNTNLTIDKNMIYIKRIKIKKQEKMTEINEEIIHANDFNKKNEIEKKESLEINPKEFKKDEKDIKNKETKLGKTFTEKAKNHMMKMILPIRLKGTLKEYIRKKIFKFLKELKDD